MMYQNCLITDNLKKKKKNVGIMKLLLPQNLLHFLTSYCSYKNKIQYHIKIVKIKHYKIHKQNSKISLMFCIVTLWLCLEHRCYIYIKYKQGWNMKYTIQYQDYDENIMARSSCYIIKQNCSHDQMADGCMAVKDLTQGSVMSLSPSS